VTAESFAKNRSAERNARELILGLRVHLFDTCKCGGIGAVIGADNGSRFAEFRCESCDAHRSWLSRDACDFITQIVAKFGRPTTPILIRRGERTINSGFKT